ncbi:hypothetical protein AMELA_G00167350 [Ameiurus melas]|uniref:Uncharacterized protein n=1 Tax=Ameiurus melas TaxID=219545 RepID=A0A7J6ABK2_AMEME|nr:hypothetical protein AMELA_G00167350 [Ameiurus melas]
MLTDHNAPGRDRRTPTPSCLSIRTSSSTMVPLARNRFFSSFAFSFLLGGHGGFLGTLGIPERTACTFDDLSSPSQTGSASL